MTKALMLLDLQNEMVDPKGKVGGGGLAQIVAERGVLENAARTLAAARKAGIDIVHVHLGFRPDYLDCLSVAPRIQHLKANRACILGEWGSEFAPAVAPQDGELVITKKCVNPFFNTGLLNWLQARGVTAVALGGVATPLVVEASARFADDAGLEVTVLEDLCAAPNAELHTFSTTRILPMFGRVIASADYIKELA